MIRSLLFFAFLLRAGFSVAGGPVSWAFSLGPEVNGQCEVLLTATCEEGWHLYALTLPRDDGPFPTEIRVQPDAAFELVGAPVEPTPIEVEDPNFQMLVRYHGHTSVFRVPVRRLSKDAFKVSGQVEYMCCNDKMCLPPVKVEFHVPIPAVK